MTNLGMGQLSGILTHLEVILITSVSRFIERINVRTLFSPFAKFRLSVYHLTGQCRFVRGSEYCLLRSRL